MKLTVILGWLVAVFAVIAGVAAGIKLGWRTLRKLVRFLDDWFGEGDRLGVIARLDRLEIGQAQTRAEVAEVKAQLHPNGGASVADTLNRVATAVGATPAPPPPGGN